MFIKIEKVKFMKIRFFQIENVILFIFHYTIQVEIKDFIKK
jgi:hypothetical protein